MVVLTVTVLTGKRSARDFFDWVHLQIRHMVKNRHLAKSIHYAGWGQFKRWVRYDGQVYGVPVIAVEP